MSFSYLLSFTKDSISAIICTWYYRREWRTSLVSSLSPVCRLPLAEDPGPPFAGICQCTSVGQLPGPGRDHPGHLRSPPSENKYHHRIYWHQDWVSRCFPNKHKDAARNVMWYYELCMIYLISRLNYMMHVWRKESLQSAFTSIALLRSVSVYFRGASQEQV